VQVKLVDRLTEAQILELHALYQHEWWTQGRTLADVRVMLENTQMVIGLIDESTGRLVAFCRVLTDLVFHATLYDVIVAKEHRGTGLGRRLVDAIVTHPRLARIPSPRLFCLPDMIPFYEKWGFQPVGSDITCMRLLRAAENLTPGQ
jgi:GNAT superfamily N-acetyltransferase